MSSLVENIFSPVKQAQAASGNLGGLLGNIGGRYGHLGEQYGDLGKYQVKFNPDDHFDINAYYNCTNFFDPDKLVKRY